VAELQQSHETVGIVGFGDLGTRLFAQIAATQDWEVAVYDPRSLRQFVSAAVDPDLGFNPIGIDRADPRGTVEEVLEADIVHWCAPLSALDSVDRLPPDTLLVLHDSVMSSSEHAKLALLDRIAPLSKVAIAHCLMNRHRRVVVDHTSHSCRRLMQHFSTIGLDPQEMTIEKHDTVMAASQGVAALLVAAFKPLLEEHGKAGHLTPSGEDVLHMLRSREISWTPATLRSLLENEQLRPVFDTLLAQLPPK